MKQTMQKQKSQQQATFLTAAQVEPDDDYQEPQTYAQTLSKQQKKLFNDVVVHGDQEQAEDFQTAMSLLNKYQKDKDFFKKDVQKVKKEAEFVL